MTNLRNGEFWHPFPHFVNLSVAFVAQNHQVAHSFMADTFVCQVVDLQVANVGTAFAFVRGFFQLNLTDCPPFRREQIGGIIHNSISSTLGVIASGEREEINPYPFPLCGEKKQGE